MNRTIVILQMNKNLKSKITELRKNGDNYNQIQRKLGCSKGTISFHLGDGVKSRQLKKQNEGRTKNVTELKLAYGGKCTKCGYSKCLKALEFHHKDPTTKVKEVSYNRASVAMMAAEAKKCILLCANCHREEHA